MSFTNQHCDTDTDQEAVSIREAAAILGVTPSRVSQLKRAGILPAVGPPVRGAPVSAAAVRARAAGPARSGGPRPTSERARVELTGRHLDILRTVWDADSPVTGPEIAYALGSSPSSLTRSLYRLAELGYLIRAGRLESRGRPVLWAPNKGPFAPVWPNQADADIAAGRVTFYGSDAEFLASLDTEGSDDG